MSPVPDLADLVNAVTLAAGDASQAGRRALHKAAERLAAATIDPEEAAQRFALQPLAQACMCAASRCGLLRPWEGARTAAELAQQTGADEMLIERLMRAMVQYGVFIQVGESSFAHSVSSRALSSEPLNRNLLPMALRILPGISKLPEYLESISWRNPGADPSDKTLFSFTNNTDLEFFEWMQQHPAQLKSFNESMAATVALERARYEKGFADLYPFEEELGHAAEGEDDVVLVDVGGGYGHVLEDIRKHLPGFKGRMVLEDLPKTVEAAVKLENVEVVAYNFFTAEQPVKGAVSEEFELNVSSPANREVRAGARAYLMRHVLTDWSDHQARIILRNTIPALKPRHSRLLLVELVRPARNDSIYTAMMDVNMMRYSGLIRSEKQWRDLVESVGLVVRRILPPLQHDSVIEIILPE